MKANRENKRKHKKGCGCKLCKPHKGKWEPFFKSKDISKMKAMKEEFENTVN